MLQTARDGGGHPHRRVGRGDEAGGDIKLHNEVVEGARQSWLVVAGIRLKLGEAAEGAWRGGGEGEGGCRQIHQGKVLLLVTKDMTVRCSQWRPQPDLPHGCPLLLPPYYSPRNSLHCLLRLAVSLSPWPLPYKPTPTTGTPPSPAAPHLCPDTCGQRLARHTCGPAHVLIPAHRMRSTQDAEQARVQP